MRKAISKILFISVLLVVTMYSNLISQMSVLKFERFSVKDGLSSNSILDVIQDSNDYIWITTTEGINRYDGYEFKEYLHKKGDTCSISEGEIFGIAEDSDYIWMGSSRGTLNRYNKTTGCFKKYSIYYKDKLWNHAIWNIKTEIDSIVWLGTERGLVKFNAKEERFIVFQPTVFDSLAFTVADNVVYSVHQNISDKTQLLLGTRGGLLIFNKKTKGFSRFKNFKSQVVINDIFQENENVTWLATGFYGLVKIEKDKDKFEFFTPHDLNRKHATIHYVKKKSDNEYWVGFFDYGLAIFNSDSKKFTFFKDISQYSSNFPSKTTNVFFETKDGTFIVGTINGLFISKKKNRKFKHFFLDNNKSERPVFFFTRDLIEISDSTYLVVLTQQLPIIIDKFSGKIKKTLSISESIVKDLKQIEFSFLVTDNIGRIWLTSNHGLFMVDLESGVIDSPKVNCDFDISDSYMFKTARAGNYIFVSVYNPLGLLKIDTRIDSAVFLKDFFDSNNIRTIRDLYVQNNNEIIITSVPTSIKYNIGKNKFSKIGKGKVLKQIEHEWINCGIANGDDILFGYGRKAINILNQRSDSIMILNKEKGLSSNQIFEFEKDDKGNIWIATGGGLNVLSSKNYNIIAQFNQEDGLMKNNLGVYWGSTFKSLKSGEMFVGGHSFFTVFHPDSVLKSENQPVKLRFESLSIYGKEKRFEKVLSKMKKIALNRSENSFTVKFANLDFNRKSNEEYKYRLLEYDEKWNYTNNNYFSFNKIPPGEYKLELALKSSDVYKTLGIVIIPIWWQTWWFKLLFGLFNIGILFFLYRRRIAYVKEKERLKAKFDKTLLETEIKMIQSQMNSHFLFNTLNSIKNYIIKNETRLAVSYLNNFAILIRKILNNSEYKFVSLENELDTIKLYLDLEMLRFEDRFDYEIDVDSEVDIKETLVPPLLLQPFVENAIWHGLLHKKGKGQVLIHIQKYEDVIRYIIVDNGVGREKAESMKSKTALFKKNYGLRLSKERLETLKNMYNLDINFKIIDLYNEMKNAEGTKVTVDIKGSRS